jgi:3-deoxy-D-manno-octulosonic-acid transferase
MPRAGLVPPPPAYTAAHPRLWIHGASVGEISAIPPIIAEVRAALPEAGVMVSAFTDTGLDAASRLVGPESSFALPLDLPGPLGRAFDALAPGALLIAETELWQGLLAEAGARGVPVVLVNGRLTPASVSRYRLLAPLLKNGLRRLRGVAAQSQADAERFARLGVPAPAIAVVGSSKFDAEICGESASPPRLIAGRPVLVAGSTREGDEALVLAALELLARRGGPRPMVILAPRHLTRLPEVEREVARRGLSAIRRSALPGALADAAARAGGSSDLLLLDTLGELAEAYRLGSVAVVGGGFRGHGSHNLLEPAMRGRAVVFGGHQRSSAGEVELLIESGGGVRASDSASLAAALEPLLADPEAARLAGERARAAVMGARGAAKRAVAFVIERLGFESMASSRRSSS